METSAAATPPLPSEAENLSESNFTVNTTNTASIRGDYSRPSYNCYCIVIAVLLFVIASEILMCGNME